MVSGQQMQQTDAADAGGARRRSRPTDSVEHSAASHASCTCRRSCPSRASHLIGLRGISSDPRRRPWSQNTSQFNANALRVIARHDASPAMRPDERPQALLGRGLA